MRFARCDGLIRGLVRAGLAGALVLAAAPGLQGCTHLPAARGVAEMPADARASPERYVVVTVRNTPSALNPHAGSTSRGYGGYRPYRASAAAVELAHRIAEQHGLREVAAWPIELLRVHCVVYALPATAQRDQVLAALRDDAAVESAQVLTRIELQAGGFNDPYASLQRNLQDMNVSEAQQWSRGEGVRVAVIDTGVDTAHPDFGGRLAAVRDFVADGRRLGERHGTAVAGIIAAVPNNGIGIAGIAPHAHVMSLRACWAATGDPQAGSCNSFTLAQALIAALKSQAALVNLSLAGPDDPLLRRIVESGMKRGTVFVGAVPTSDRREGFPTGIDGVIAVGVAGHVPQAPRTVMSPGVDVFTLSPQGRYDATSGSSVAAAGVTAVAALLLAQRPALTAREIEALLQRSMQGGAPPETSATVNACLALRELGAGACGDARLSETAAR
jgi:hypothetical protein